MFNRILADNNLKFDRSGKAGTAHSLRHSYICFRLLEGADIYQIAKNCRTSVEMIEKHYAAHLKDMIDTSLVNVRRTRSPRKDSAAKTIEPAKGRMLERPTLTGAAAPAWIVQQENCQQLSDAYNITIWSDHARIARQPA